MEIFDQKRWLVPCHRFECVYLTPTRLAFLVFFWLRINNFAIAGGVKHPAVFNFSIKETIKHSTQEQKWRPF